MSQPSRAPRGVEPPIGIGDRPSARPEQPARLRHRGRPRFGSIPRALLRDSSISRDARLLWGYLEDYSNGQDDAPWPSQETQAADMGCTDRSIRNWLNELVRNGWLEVEHRPGTSNLHWLIWDRADEVPRNVGSALPRNVDSGVPRNVGSDKEEPLEEEPLEENPPPTPSDGGGDGSPPELFADSRKGNRRRRVQAAKRQASSMVVAAGETFWEDWPNGKGRGAKATFMDAWCKRLAAGADRNGKPVTISEYMTRRDHYRDARARYCRFWKDRGVEAHAPMLNGSTFVNSKSHLWAEEWDDEDIRYWPPPRGYDWDDGPAEHGAVVGRSMFDALDAAIAAERAAREVG